MGCRRGHCIADTGGIAAEGVWRQNIRSTVAREMETYVAAETSAQTPYRGRVSGYRKRKSTTLTSRWHRQGSLK